VVDRAAYVLFSVFAQLDRPRMRADGARISCACDLLVQAILVQVLIAFLPDSFANQEEFAAGNAFQMAGHLLASITSYVIELLKRVYADLRIPTLANQLLERSFLDFR
jgi:hypothetical protein